MLNWEMEFKKFLPGFKILTYYGNTKERKEKRKGWNAENMMKYMRKHQSLEPFDESITDRSTMPVSTHTYEYLACQALGSLCCVDAKL